MKISQIRIRNYKSIIDTGWVPIEGDITTLLGRNESGKSSFLQAIRFYDNNKEIQERELNDSQDYSENPGVPIVSLQIELGNRIKNRYPENSDEIVPGEEVITTKFSDGSRGICTNNGKDLNQYIDAREKIIQLAKSVWESMADSSDMDDLNFRNEQEINNLQSDIGGIKNDNNNNIDNLENKIENILDKLNDLSEQNKKESELLEEWVEKIQDCYNIASSVSNKQDPRYLFPSIVYHGVFDSINDEVHANSINKEEHRTFKNLLDFVGLDYDNFENIDYHDQNTKLKSAEGTIRGKMNELWKQKEVDVDIRYRDQRFTVGIEDTALAKDSSDDIDEISVDRSLKKPSERSKGFQWFFSFYINLSAETYKEKEPNQLILLDDPAVFLHPEGKKNWLNAIEDLSESAQIIYSSHSPFLIRKKYPNRIRVVEDTNQSGTEIKEEYYDSDDMALEPLRNALGIGLGDSPFVSKRKILVEGVSDYEILTGLANFFRDHVGEDILSWEEVTIMPTNGGNNMIRAAKWVSSEEFSYVLLLDNDQKGKEVYQEIEDDHQEILSDRVILLEKDDDERNFNIDIEDLFAPEFYVDCVNTAYSDQFDDFEPISVENLESSWEIDGYEYTGRKIVKRIENGFDDRGRGDLDKILVANEIRDRLTNNREVSETDVEYFKPVLGRIRNFI
jgi:predicted ATP-dependent endonuclease of OLD family